MICYSPSTQAFYDTNLHPSRPADAVPENRRRWFCSEWVGKALGLPESWRFSPNDLAVIARMGREEK